MFVNTPLVALAGMAAAAFSGVAAQDAVQTNVPKFQFGTPSATAPGVVGKNKNGPTNPDAAQMNTPINQTSMARLASINSVDDWCTFSSPDGQPISDTESFTVAYCTKPRNNARVIVSVICVVLKRHCRCDREKICSDRRPCPCPFLPLPARRHDHGGALCQDASVRAAHGSR